MSTAETQQTDTAPAVQQKTELTASERFTNMVVKEFSANTGVLNLTSFQKKLIQNYFIKLDATLKDNEIKRMAKKEQYRDLLEFSWTNINMIKLTQDVVAYSSVGLDPAQANHINLIPYKNSHTNKFDIGIIIGYRGAELKATKYGLNFPDDVIVELVYSSDKFKSIKKDINNSIESYTFNVVDDFDRGEVVGGFYYHVFKNNPHKNKLKTMSLKDILKRKPEKVSAEFWGGEKDEWKDGQKTGNKVKVDGWYEEMCYKTVYRAAFNDITIDSEKIDEHYLKVISSESQIAETVNEQVEAEIQQKANKKQIGFNEPIQIETKKNPVKEVLPTDTNPVQEEKPAQTNKPDF